MENKIEVIRNTIKFSGAYMVGSQKVETLTVNPINLRKLVDANREMMREIDGNSDQTAINVIMTRKCLTKQLVMKDASGNNVPVSDISISQMPRKLYSLVYSLMDAGGGTPGEKIGAGDGIDTPLLFRLGTPLKLSVAGAEAEATISELEFVAKTAGDIERVLAAPTDYEKVIALLEDCCNPVSPDATLIKLPSWLIDQITIEDGLSIMRNVLRDFL